MIQEITAYKIIHALENNSKALPCLMNELEFSVFGAQTH